MGSAGSILIENTHIVSLDVHWARILHGDHGHQIVLQPHWEQDVGLAMGQLQGTTACGERGRVRAAITASVAGDKGDLVVTRGPLGTALAGGGSRCPPGSVNGSGRGSKGSPRLKEAAPPNATN